MSEQDPGFGVYVHWPFCRTLCPYCDFNVHSETDIDEAAWCQALRDELAHYAAETGGRTVTSLYFGGGTPSLMSPETIAALIDDIGRHWTVRYDIEITLETNPTSSERERLREFRAAGINRVSVGVQSLDDEALRFLGRQHSAEDAIRTLEAAQSIFPRTTFDLIYARPAQTPDAWQSELQQALSISSDHISLYQLTIEPGTPFSRSGLKPIDEDAAADMFEATQAILNAAGLPSYEISNHARPGGESRHNLTCWRGGDYLGIGPGAHGRLTLIEGIFGTHQIHNPKRWLERARQQGHGTAKRRLLNAEDRARELVMMGLRLVEGLNKARFREITDLPLEQIIDTKARDRLINGNLLLEDDTRLYASAEGRQKLNAVLASLLN
ncbi:MAG: radical SAM family heme chaperone HemW [Rhodospirillales bacterium]